MMVNILILFDQEGCIGVSCNNTDEQNNHFYKEQCQKTIDWINRTYSESHIFICDLHCNGTILSNSLANYASNITFFKMPWNIDFSFKYDFALILGFHGHSQTSDPLGHTFRVEITKATHDHNIIGEISIFIKFLEENGVFPTFISGNNFILEEQSTKHIPQYVFSPSTCSIQKCYLEYFSCLTDSINSCSSKKKIKTTILSDSNIKLYFANDEIVKCIKGDNYSDNYLTYKTATSLIMDFDDIAKVLNRYHLMYYKYLNKIRNLPNTLFIKHRNNPLLKNFFEAPNKYQLTELVAIYNLLTNNKEND